MPSLEIREEDIIFDKNVQKFCIDSNFKCPNYNKYWACPPHAPYMEQNVLKFEKYYLIYVKFDLKSYIKREKEKYPNRSIDSIKNRFFVSNFMRNMMEDELFSFLEDLQGTYKDKLILWDGHCLVCEKEGFKDCSLKDNLPCRFPGKIRYSMESVGIHVTNMVKKLNLPIEWPPEKYCYRFSLVCLIE